MTIVIPVAPTDNVNFLTFIASADTDDFANRMKLSPDLSNIEHRRSLDNNGRSNPEHLIEQRCDIGVALTQSVKTLSMLATASGINVNHIKRIVGTSFKQFNAVATHGRKVSAFKQSDVVPGTRCPVLIQFRHHYLCSGLSQMQGINSKSAGHVEHFVATPHKRGMKPGKQIRG